MQRKSIDNNVSTLGALSEEIRGVLLFLALTRNARIPEDQQYIQPSMDGRIFNWLTYTPPRAINPYQQAFDKIGFPDELIPEQFYDTQEHTLLWDPEPAIKKQMDFFVQEATKQVDAIRYRTLGSQLFCSPKPVSDNQYQAIRDHIVLLLNLDNRSKASLSS